MAKACDFTIDFDDDDDDVGGGGGVVIIARSDWNNTNYWRTIMNNY